MKTISCMNIDENKLYSSGGEIKTYKKGEMIYREGQHALYYFQIIEGKVKLNNYDDDGKEFIQNIFVGKQSFGDSLLFVDKFYPTNAVCIAPSEIIKVPKEQFLNLMKKDPDLSLEMNACLSQRLYFKAIMLQNMASLNPISRLTGFLDYLKSYHDDSCGNCFHVELTRQQIANLLGLRVETVIRALKKMEKQGNITLENRKIIY
ncbi:Crp/Fnr family transcriptional regulator [Chryseobacterium sp. W4I1]|uniref:Crp/Fnr family transcriptional regulator n=1 Tax=Chryseobacterium sp. W4I1 TaxID=3042293 RepID=UPI002781484A|nr:Crp/Fnr family transcriptional regulator [Chryseobacterium sp. W4I1]MDQ0781743.1 CRP-like cAMP-binding protein [Chryseobacterium sp. W4I1]